MQDTPEPDGETKQEYAADDVVGDLYPSPLAQFERTVGHEPGIVARTCGPKDEQDHNVEQRTNGTARQERFDRYGLLSSALCSALC